MVESMEYDVSGDTKKGYVKTKTVSYIIVALLLLLIIVTLMTGLLAAKNAREEVEAKYKKQISGTALPTTSIEQTMTTKLITTKWSTTTTQGSCNKAWCHVRLPTSLIPYNYKLYLEPNVEALEYSGLQKIFFEVVNDTQYIIVHIKLMEIDDVTVLDSSNKSLEISNSFYYPENEYYVVELKQKLTKGLKYSIALKFHANISDGILTGFYKSSYKENNKEKRLLTTKFQPTDARKAFPCFDEPDLKATFDITIRHSKEYKAHSNMPVINQTENNGRVLTTFDTTVKMSPYLICFIVSQFTFKYEEKSGIANNVTITIWSRPDEVNSTEYAFNASKEMFTYLEKYLDVPYPMPKLDMFAIPDYGSGATEHWGIITYRESRLLYTSGLSSKANQRSTADIIAHECAHLWFGNLVTCKWWNDLWVQEGLASYLKYTTVNNSHPEWNLIDKFLISDWKTGMDLDALASSHPISQPVEHPKQIKEIFDSITYSKGSSLFQMLDYFLGNDLFRKGLNRYLINNQYKGATADDLWDAFSSVARQNITKMMNTWTHQMGYPVININKTGDKSFTLVQKHFLIDPEAIVVEKSPYDYEWVIPFTYTTNENLSVKNVTIIDTKAVNINSSASWILGNYMHRGFYRVNYDRDGWKHIIEQLNKDSSMFLVTDRAGLIDDAFNLARSGQLDYTIALDLLSFTENDTNELVWNMVSKNLGYLDLVLSSQNVYPLYKAFVSSKIRKQYQNSPDGYLSRACSAGVQDAIDDVRKMFNDWKTNGTIIPADIRSTVYYFAVAFGGIDEWEFVFEKFKATQSASERSRLQSALGATRHIWILNTWLEMTINASIVRTQDTAYVISNIAESNPVGKYLAWSFANENWQTIYNIAKENNFHVAAITEGLTAQFTTEYDLKQVEALWIKYPEAGAGKNARQQGIEKIKANILWLKKNYKSVENWLRQKKS